VKNRAALARREGVSAMWVTHVLGLLELDPEVLAFIEQLPAGLPARLVSGRELRLVRTLGQRQQVELLASLRVRVARWRQPAA
jgi:hypothetical protein